MIATRATKLGPDIAPVNVVGFPIHGRTDHDLTVIVPAYNEERRLPSTLTALCESLDGWRLDYRVLVVDDGSNDATMRCVAAMGWRVSAIGLPRHRGKGAAVRAGMLAATGEVLSFTDADLPYDLRALRRGYEFIRAGRCDVVYGARNVAGATCRVPRRLVRTTASFAFRRCMRWLVSRDVTDTQCGLKLFSRRAAVELFSRVTIDGFAFDAEVVYLADRLGLTWRCVPVSLVNDYASTLSLSRHALPMLLDVLRVRRRDRRGDYQLGRELATSVRVLRERTAHRLSA